MPNHKRNEWLRKLGFEYPELPEGMYARAAEAVVASIDEEKHSFECIVATEGRVLMPDWNRMEMVEEVLLMSGVDIPERGVPLLNSHMRFGCGSVYGSTRELRVEGNKLVGRNYFDSEDPEAARVYRKYKDGHLRGFSVGYRVHKAVYIEPGKSKEIAGRTWTAGKMPLRMAVRWQVLENSCVVIGADGNAVARTLTIIKEGCRMKFADFCRMLGIDPDKLNASQRAGLEALHEARAAALEGEPEPAAIADVKERAANIVGAGVTEPKRENEGFTLDVADLASQVVSEAQRQQSAQEQERRSGIEALFSRHDSEGDFKSIKERALSSGMSVREANDALLDAVRAGYGSPMTHVPLRPNKGAEGLRVLEAALLMTTGQVDEERMVKDYGEQVIEAARKDYRGYGIRHIVEDFARMSGSHVPRTFDDGVIQRALMYSRDIEGRAGSGMSNISLPGILSNVANKIMLQAYESVPSVADKLCAAATATDFKQQTRYRIIDGGRFQRLTEGGELQHGSFGEESYTVKLDTHGRIDFITRQMMYNDDVQVFSDLSQTYGRNAILLKEELFFGRLLDKISDTDYFKSGVNRFGGEDTAFGLAGLKKLDLAFEERTDKAGKPINVVAKYILAPSPLKADILSFFATEKFGDMGSGGSGTATKNPYYQSFSPLTSAFLHKFMVQEGRKLKLHTNASSNRWFGFADPAVVASFVMLYFRGRRAPVFESVPADPAVLAIGVRGYWDIECGEQDPVGVVALDGE